MLIGGFLCLFLLAGAGCASEKPDPQTKQADTNQNTVENTAPEASTEETKKTAMDFTLQAEQAGKGRVRFSWSVPDGVKAKDGFRIVRGPKENPSYPGNFWYHPKDANGEAFWINLPKGTQHFRVCAFEANTCTAYSNDAEITVE